MGIDPNELLIFKKRHITIENVGNTAPTEAEDHNLPEVYKEQFTEQYAYGALPAQPSGKGMQASAQPNPLPHKQPGSASLATQRTEAPKTKDVPASKSQQRPFTASEKSSIKAAKDKKCINHPWRQAYAICTICHNPYCYTDLINSGGAFYCTDDIGVAPREQHAHRLKFNTYSYLASLLAAAYSTLLLYRVYPQFLYIINYAYTVGIVTFLFKLDPSYYMPLINLVLVALGYIAAVLIMSTSVPLFATSSFVVGLSLVILSYEYLTTNATYLFTINLIGFATMCSMVISRMVSALNKHAIEEMPLNLERYILRPY